MKKKLQLILSYLFSFHLICFHSWLPLLWDFPPGKALQLSLLQAESSSCLLPHLWWNSITVIPRVSPAHPPVLSAQFSRSVMSDSLQTHGLQHARLPCPSPTPGACSNSCPSSQWCHTTILPSVVPFSSSLQSFPACLFQGVSSSHQVAKVLEFQLQHQSFRISFRMDWLDLLAVQGTLFSNMKRPVLSALPHIPRPVLTKEAVGKIFSFLIIYF